MAAIIYRKRSLFEDLQSPPPISASSPVSNKLRSSCFSTYSILFDQLRALFPEIHTQVLFFSFISIYKFHLVRHGSSNWRFNC